MSGEKLRTPLKLGRSLEFKLKMENLVKIIRIKIL